MKTRLIVLSPLLFTLLTTGCERSEGLSNLEGDVGSLDTRYATVEARVTDLENAQASCEERVSSLEADNARLQGELADTNQILEDLKTDVTARLEKNETDIGDNSTEISSIETNATDLEDKIDKYDDDFTYLYTQLDGLESCPADTTEFSGWCVEDTSRGEMSWFDGRDTCAAEGKQLCPFIALSSCDGTEASGANDPDCLVMTDSSTTSIWMDFSMGQTGQDHSGSMASYRGDNHFISLNAWSADSVAEALCCHQLSLP